MDVSNSLGIQKMPKGYKLMLTEEGGHFYWLKDDGTESVIHWNKWAIYRHSVKHSKENKGE